MPMNLVQLRFCLSRLGHWMKEQVVTEVPAELAICEFDCRQAPCSSEEWATCQRRISRAAGELMPFVREDHADIVLDVESDREPVGAT
jgi:hypothetical protein